jgi:hypothetical protein
MAKHTNSLTSHHGESRNYRADKMSYDKNWTRMLRGKSKRWEKHFSNRKRRMFLKNPKFFGKI